MSRICSSFTRRVVPFIGAGLSLLAQDASRASQIYADSSKSVFVLIAKSEKGDVVGQGTGFLVSGGRIITNEHVASAGSISIDLGAVRIPATVELIDTHNDLAVLSTGAEMSVKPLAVSSDLPAPGANVYVIGNPAGLERTLSTGVVSGIREMEGRQLIQLTAPISPGSSGGPVLNASGEVIGVAVGILQSGQNLNFAVPALFVQRLLRGDVQRGTDFTSSMNRADELTEKQLRLTYSAQPDSEWQKIDKEIDAALIAALGEAGSSVEMLLKVAEKARFQNTDITLSAAERAVKVKSTFETNFTLGESLRSKASSATGGDKTAFLERAERALRLAFQLSKPPGYAVTYDLADVIEDRGAVAEADTLFRRALELSKSSGDTTQQAQTLRSLARTAYSLKQPSQGDIWFRSLVSLGKASAWDWEFQGRRLDSIANYNDAGQSYVEAARAGGSWTNWCEAAGSFGFVDGKLDEVLSTARRCVSEGAGKEDSEERLGQAHYQIAQVLNLRGVYQEALSQAKEASVLRPTDAWALNAQSKALQGLRRFQEAINASNQAIRLSDGKYATMHFELGSSYFGTENWEFARQSYEKAAQLNSKDSAAAYNVALCYAKLGYYRDAVTWYEEVLRREPNHPQKQDILNTIQIYRR
jgi:tetratricopeptide (TPR) repeat protein